MIINDAFFQLEDQNQLLIQEILASKSYKNYLLARKQMNDCLEVAKLKKTFQTEKDKFERIAAYGEYAPDYRQQQRKVRISKRALDLNEKVAAFRLAETDFQQLLDEIGIRLAQVISSEIKVDAGNPFFETGNHSCKGNCHG
ncbi:MULTISPECIES: YlbF family regulator [Enterococcus]|uniref:YlbF family regulator n=1 Tax=Candidatus Enterococcus murrayae TaxID=2815321 RepID=A0ABS3HGZ3_9ENTE|nr:YlbF family regulator [Enterococcus sp. MJM16]MBO0452728.1 YlbF family regulator [Enterococcus sp. MJM16]